MPSPSHSDLAARLILAMLASIPAEVRDPKRHWDWARKALEIGGARARTYDRLIAEMAGQLLIDGALTRATAATVLEIEGELDDLPALLRACRQDAVYIVALAQVMRGEQKEQNQ